MPLDRLVREGLLASPKRLPPLLFYDDEGSALFDAITRTPEYYLTRTERAILERHGDEILALASTRPALTVVELGAGTSEKTRVLLRRLLARQAAVDFLPIDISAGTLLASARAMERELPGLRVRPLVGDNVTMLRTLPRDEGARLLLFIGSSIGNYEPTEATAFLARLAGAMRPQDRLLLGTDLVKDKALLDAAYDDAEGLTARFNLNALARLNRDHGADFALDAFTHKAFYDPAARRIEMHLVATRAQTVHVPKLDLVVDVAQGETIHTENSYKYTQDDVGALAGAAGLRVARTWMDEAGWFAVHLLERVPE